MTLRKMDVLKTQTCPTAILSITNPTWTALGINPSSQREWARGGAFG
jgi:hypothetical protein